LHGLVEMMFVQPLGKRPAGAETFHGIKRLLTGTGHRSVRTLASKRSISGKTLGPCEFLDDGIVPLICPTRQMNSQIPKMCNASSRQPPAPLHGVVFDIFARAGATTV
jgi:hypothetical protein